MSNPPPEPPPKQTSAPAPATPKPNQPVVSRQSSGCAPAFFIVASIGLVIVGLGLVGSGLIRAAAEEVSAARETIYAVQYGSGFIVIALGMILGALTGILMKR